VIGIEAIYSFLEKEIDSILRKLKIYLWFIQIFSSHGPLRIIMRVTQKCENNMVGMNKIKAVHA